MSVQLLAFVVFLAEAYCQSSLFLRSSGYSVIPDPGFLFQRNPLITFLEEQHRKQGGLYRTLTLPKHDIFTDTIPRNANLIYDYNATLTYRSGCLISFFDFFAADWSFASKHHDELGIRYLVTEDSDAATLGLPRVFSWNGKGVIERTDAKPIVRLDKGHPESNIREVSWVPNGVRIVVDSADADRLIFAQSYFPGWRVTVNGVRQKVEKSQIFMGVSISSGQNIVEWEYRPYWFPVGMGLWLCIGTLFATSLSLNRRKLARRQVT